MKIGQLVQQVAPLIFDYCEQEDPVEFARLQDPRYSKEVFDINFPFCRPVAKISNDDRVRYYIAEHRVHGQRVRVTSQWFNPPTSKSLPLLRQYLFERGLAPSKMDFTAEKAPHNMASPTATPSVRGARGRFRSHPIGNAQNALVRYLLSQLGDESFTENDWKGVIADFDHACAYCGAVGEVVRDHVIPINRLALGEHRLGNLVPACRPCNATKGERNFQEFLKDRPERIPAILAHMERRRYYPLGENLAISTVLEEARLELSGLAARALEKLNAAVQDKRQI